MASDDDISVNTAAGVCQYCYVPVEELYTKEEHEIYQELIYDRIWDLCFEVHRSVKLNYYIYDPLLSPFFDLEYNSDVKNLENGERQEKEEHDTKKVESKDKVPSSEEKSCDMTETSSKSKNDKSTLSTNEQKAISYRSPLRFLLKNMTISNDL